MSLIVPKIRYTEGWKYMLDAPVSYELSERWVGMPDVDAAEFNISNRMMTIYENYPWDGASGPTIDTTDTMVPSLIHDVLYECFRQRLLDRDKWRPMADREFQDLCIACGMWDVRADTWYEAVHLFAESASDPGSEREVLQAP